LSELSKDACSAFDPLTKGMAFARYAFDHSATKTPVSFVCDSVLTWRNRALRVIEQNPSSSVVAWLE